jgi:hypothetical protein
VLNSPLCMSDSSCSPMTDLGSVKVRGETVVEDELVHEGAEQFDDFVEAELKGLAERAEEAGICLDCLSDRLVVELVAGLVRSGTPVADILNMVAEGLDEAEEEEAEKSWRPRRMH